MKDTHSTSTPNDAPGKDNSITIALAGNPNCGKTTLFNDLTGSDQVVGNWSGVTVQRLEGRYSFSGVDVNVIDLPGIYSLSAQSVDETIARNYIIEGQPDLVVNIVDGSNLQRNLYLTAQLLEMNVPVIVAVNMMDIVRRRGVKIDIDHMAAHLGCKVFPITARSGEGVGAIKRAVADFAANREENSSSCKFKVTYDSEVEEALPELEEALAPIATASNVCPRWLAIKLLARDNFAKAAADDATNELAWKFIQQIEQHTGDDIDMVLADGRHGFARGLARDVVHETILNRRRVSDIVDKIVLNKVLCMPIFALVMYVTFSVTIKFSGPFIDFFDGIFGAVFVDGVAGLLAKVSAPQWLILLLADGVGGGLQTISTFIPPIFLIFMCLSILADSGYMARAAFVMDRLLRPIGLPGKAFLPMLVGFGCNVPGVMAARVLENKRDRYLTVLANPFMSCGARLPVYLFFGGAFFASNQGLLIFCLYVGGIFAALITTLLLGKTLMAGETSSFVMELPPYHMPTVRGVFHHTWNNLKSFIFRAGKVIILVIIVLTLIMNSGIFPEGGAEATPAAKAATFIFRPMGISEDNWPAAAGLVTGVFAKEAVVGTLQVFYGHDPEAGEETEVQVDQEDQGVIKTMFSSIGQSFTDLGAGLVGLFSGEEEEESEDSAVYGTLAEKFQSKPAAVAYLVFILLYTPCVAVIAAIYHETNLAWTAFSILYQCLLAWVAATIIYQACQLTTTPVSASIWLAICAIITAVSVLAMRSVGRRARTTAVE